MDTTARLRVLVAEDEEPVRSVICRLLARDGFDPVGVSAAREAIERYRSLRPALVVADLVMPGLDGLALLAELRRIDPAALLILVTGQGGEQVLLDALRGGAAGFLQKPFTGPELAREVRRVLAHRRLTQPPRVCTPCLVEERLCFELPTERPEVPPVIDRIVLSLRCRADEGQAARMGVGVEEMITNAIEHGNLGITAAEKSDALAANAFERLVARRLASPGIASRRVVVACRLDRAGIEVVVSDEGAGFDWRRLASADPRHLAAYGGRGILLARLAFDEVRYEDPGNRVTLVRALR